MNIFRRAAAALACVATFALPMSAARAAEVGVTDTEITIGLFGPMSGQLAAFGFDPVQAARMWYEEFENPFPEKIRIL